MTHVRSTGQTLLPWLVLGPLFAGAGAVVGLLCGSASLQGASSLADPAPGQDPSSAARVSSTGLLSDTGILGDTGPRDHSAGVTTRSVGFPSLAPLVDGARDAVVGVRTVHMPGPVVAVGDASSPIDQPEGVTRGTGFVIHEDGLVLTAHHVVERPSRILVEVPGIGQREAEVVGEDAVTDIALLRIIDAPDELPTLRLGDSREVRQGDWVVTIGNPLRLQHTVGAGVVGFVGRHIGEGPNSITNEHIQFTGPAYPGSSGSPVLDLGGAVVGMTTRAAVDGDGFAFAVTSRVIGNVLASMDQHDGRVRRAHLGAGVGLARGRGRLGEHPAAAGLAVEMTAVTKGYAADRAGLCAGDVVVAISGRPIVSLEDFYDTVTWAEPRTELEFAVVRGDDPVSRMKVVLGELGDPPRELTQ